jgi:hypothetical protein
LEACGAGNSGWELTDLRATFSLLTPSVRGWALVERFPRLFADGRWDAVGELAEETEETSSSREIPGTESFSDSRSGLDSRLLIVIGTGAVAADIGSGRQRHHISSGIIRLIAATCCPQPAQVVFPQWLHLSGRHIFVVVRRWLNSAINKVQKL